MASDNIATILGLNNNDEYCDDGATGPSMVAAASAASSLPSWHEKTLLDSQYSEDYMIEEMNDQLESFEDKSLQELCATEKTFDIDQTATKRRSMKHYPKKHKHLFRYSPDISVGESSEKAE